MNPFDSSVAERFFARVIVQPDGCHIWRGCTDRRGYGVVTVKRKWYSAHRLAWLLAHDSIPKGIFVCHKCHVPQCVAITHLYLGKPSENSHYMAIHGRARNMHLRPLPMKYPPSPILPKKTMEERFFEKVDRASDASGCWLWTGRKNWLGYGVLDFQIKRDGKTDEVAHRVSWRIAHGTIPQGMNVLHRCDVRHCVNPAHLFIGTQADNVNDCERKGRGNHPKGESHGHNKLTAEQVLEIRKRYQWFKMGYAKLGKLYGVTAQTVFHIVNRKIWTHI